MAFASRKCSAARPVDRRNPSNTICVKNRRSNASMRWCVVSRMIDGPGVHRRASRLHAAGRIAGFMRCREARGDVQAGKASIRCLKRETRPTVVVSTTRGRCAARGVTRRSWSCRRTRGNVRSANCRSSIHRTRARTWTAPGDRCRRRWEEFEGGCRARIRQGAVQDSFVFVAQGGMGIILRGLHKERDMPAAVKR